jgi:hypothetical protein
VLIVEVATWPDVGLALIAALPGILTLVLQLVLRSNLKTPSGETLGKVVEHAHDTAIANNLRLTAITEKVGAAPSAEADALEAKHSDATDAPPPPQP